MKADLRNIRRLVGPVQAEELRYVDCFLGGEVGLFMPVGGACYFSLTPLHSHPSYMFVLPFDDQTVLRLNGGDVAAVPGKLLSLSPGMEHHELPSGSPPRYIAIFITRGFFEEELLQYPIGREAVFRGESHDVLPDLLPLLKKFMIEADNNAPGADAVLRGLGIEICHSIIRGMFGFLPGNDRVTGRVEINRVVEYLHANLGDKTNVRKMAGVANMSASHFSRVFREEMGRPPMDYLNDIRIRRAKKLLLAGEKSITEIALECGFNSPSYLSDRFYRQYKITPSGFRKSLKSKNNNRILKD
jgi:AraC-like DNA-binding protein